MSPSHRRWWAVLGVGVLVIGVVWGWATWTAPVRGAVQTYAALIAAANRQDVAAARLLCTREFAATHPLQPAREGGLIGLPRNIHPNFQAWRKGTDVLLCPTNRVGPVYAFRYESGAWRFDGPVGLLVGHGEFVPAGTADQPEVSGGDDG